MEIVAADIGGTHARFAIAEVENGRVVKLGEPVTMKTADHASLQTAYQAFEAGLGRPLPRALGIAVASPVANDVIRLTNNPWIIRKSLITERLNADQWVVVNDFGAVGHAVAQVPDSDFIHLCGPDTPLPSEGITTICGPGTGLGVAQLLRHRDRYQVLETEGGHMDFAPLDGIEDALLKRLRKTFTRVSAERVVAGPGIVAIYETLAEMEGRSVPSRDDRTIWTEAIDGTDSIALAALDRFCLALGAVAGDLALAQGAKAVVIAGGLGFRIKDRLVRSGFDQRFVAKGRFQTMMAAMPVKLITHPQPGLFGAAAAFAQEHTQ
ncbi:MULTISPECIES: glucokinase [Sphingomonas]|jgi:glucokinase|uniref:glucokinase n=2 Tax=Sphingomonadaceae TaxID=41297 RepID=UPI0004DB7575|nr:MULTISPECIES: glucokinase [Sphingomonas]MBB3585933.1 glucokinase [Sphingomonas sp. BK481]MBD8468603.1 glucokinase [Sphingomonas sp. CFBP 8765]MBD8639476.1 glucokinase [Sphingomonas sp. CFBP 13733]MBD8735736.1 glucokinase [Sphingomonas sp. CFBP 13706]MDY1008181.1 glucokinase [Sphingomonas sp. CFBP9019]